MDNNHITTLPAGTMLHFGTYRIERFLAKGGFGCTYLARHVMLDKPVAIKELFISDYCNRDASGTISVGVSSRKEFVDKLHRKFIAEAQAQCGMDHPGIVKVTDVFEENGTAYYVMDYIDGESLADRLKRTGRPLSEPEALGYIRQAAEALRYVHSKGRLHLDIKPGNIMIDSQGRAILIDFGVSKQYDDDGQNNSTLLASTPGYAPPEQRAGGLKYFTPASDIYSLGATLYALLTNTTPPSATDRSAGIELPPLPNNISQPTRQAIQAALTLNVTQRPSNITTFLSLLNNSAPQGSPGHTPPPPSNDDTTRYQNSNKTEILPKTKSGNFITRLTPRNSFLFYYGLSLLILIIFLFFPLVSITGTMNHTGGVTELSGFDIITNHKYSSLDPHRPSTFWGLIFTLSLILILVFSYIKEKNYYILTLLPCIALTIFVNTHPIPYKEWREPDLSISGYVSGNFDVTYICILIFLMIVLFVFSFLRGSKPVSLKKE